MFPPFVGKIFGMKNSVTMLGILGIFNGISSLLGPIIQTFIITDVTDYLIVFLIACGLTCVSLVLLFFVNDKEFEYKDVDIETNFKHDDNLIPESMRTTVKE
jgi:MFS family permease